MNNRRMMRACAYIQMKIRYLYARTSRMAAELLKSVDLLRFEKRIRNKNPLQAAGGKHYIGWNSEGSVLSLVLAVLRN